MPKSQRWVLWAAALLAALLCGGGCGEEATDSDPAQEPEEGVELASGATPPVFEPVGEERPFCSLLAVTEGEAVDVRIRTVDPDGDAITVSVVGLPDWLSFDPDSGKLSGEAPLWDEDEAKRRREQGTFDLTFSATDGTWSVDKIVSVQVLDASWQESTVADLVAGRPLAEEVVPRTLVPPRNVHSVTRPPRDGDGPPITRVTFGFRSQVPSVDGWEDDWVTTQCVAFLPADGPSVANVGAVVEGTYSRHDDFGLAELGERACAELGIPVLVIDWDWDLGHPGDTMGTYNQSAGDNRDPQRLFYAFSVAHYLRAADALATVMAQEAGWEVDLDTFRVVVTGHSKFGHTAFLSAAADPQRVVGFMSSGGAGVDGNVSRLLNAQQGATSINPEGHPGYLGVMNRTFVTDYGAQDEVPDSTFGVWTLGTNDSRGADEDYTGKYALLAVDRHMAVDHRVLTLPNAPHTTCSGLHSLVWRMLLAHVFLGRPLTTIDAVQHDPVADGVKVTAAVSGEPSVEEVSAWYTTQSDRDTSAWDGFVSVPMTAAGQGYEATIPAEATAYFVQVTDVADDVQGIVSSPPSPVDRDYPLLRLDPGPVSALQADTDATGLNLTWHNPTSTDLAGVLVVRRQGRIPSDPLDGAPVCAGLLSSCADADFDADASMGYGVFTFDATGCYSARVGLVP